MGEEEFSDVPGDEASHPDRNETEIERVDRNLNELLEEIRVAMPGVQVLFAFLLVLPFNSRFGQVTATQEKIYYGTLVCTAVAAALLIGPTMNHRLQFRQNKKERILIISHRLAIAGLSFMAVAMTGALFLVGDFVFDSTVAAIGAAIPAFVMLVVWYVLPLLGRNEA
jgi:hypothetical protein